LDGADSSIETIYYLYTALIIKSPAFLEEKFTVARKNGSDESDPYLGNCFPCFRWGRLVSLLTITDGLMRLPHSLR